MIFGSSPQLSDVPTFTVSINGFRTEHVTRFTYLGVVFEQTSWNEHVTHLITWSHQTKHQLRHCRHCLLFFPVLEYCGTVWTHSGKVSAKSLEKLQRRAARISVKTSNSEQAVSFLVFYSLADRRDKHVLRFVRKRIEGKAPKCFSNYFTSSYNIGKKNTRQQHHLHLPRFTTECGKN